jgi:murein DD-endopeptidase MepM/ murein hydrolase activator NlpD
VAAEAAKPDDFVWPVPSNVITSRFGARKDPLDPESAALHRGVDVRCPKGTAVLAAAGGEVVVAHKAGRGGVSVRIRHPNGLSTLYAHMIKAEVRQGDTVEAGQIIGRSGASGRVTGPHLHLEVWRGRKPMDPLRVAWRELGAPTAPAPAVASTGAAQSPAPVPMQNDPRLVGALAGRQSISAPTAVGAVQTLPPAHPK